MLEHTEHHQRIARQLRNQYRTAQQTLDDAILDLVIHLHERITMTDQTVTDLKTDYEAFRDTMNAKVQALMDAAADTSETIPADVQQAINALAAEMTGDTAQAAAGSAASVDGTSTEGDTPATSQDGSQAVE
jgi:hypothetical protein